MRTPQIGDIWLCHTQEGDYHFLILTVEDPCESESNFLCAIYGMIELESGWTGENTIYANHIGSDWEYVA